MTSVCGGCACPSLTLRTARQAIRIPMLRARSMYYVEVELL